MATAGTSLDEVAEGIRSMRIRGAAEIARQAARALGAHAATLSGDPQRLQEALVEAGRQLAATRPTAVSLRHAVHAVVAAARNAATAGQGGGAVRQAAVEAADRFVGDLASSQEDVVACAAGLVGSGDIVLTHCHSTTAVRALAAAHADGRLAHVYATETRPWRQGLVTTRQLAAAGVAVTLIADSAVRSVMDGKDVARVIVGADTVAGDGSLFNKVGTWQVALAARDAGIPFHGAASRYKFTASPPSDVVVEERASTELARADEISAGVGILNAVFDRTPPGLITGFATESGVLEPGAAVAAADAPRWREWQ